jgi:hypothetical protein
MTLLHMTIILLVLHRALRVPPVPVPSLADARRGPE